MTYNELQDSWKARTFFGVSEQQWRVLCLLICRPQVNHNTAIRTMWPDPDGEPLNTEKLIHILISKVRRKLKPHALTIKSVWSIGYAMENDDRKRAMELAEKAMNR